MREHGNLAERLNDDIRGKIGREAYEAYEKDEESRQAWEEKHAKWLRLYYQEDLPATEPWEQSAEESIPIVTESVNLFQSRAYKAFFPSRNFIEAVPVNTFDDPSILERAERVGKHMSFQLGIKSAYYKKDKSMMFASCALHGSDFTKTYYCPVKNENIVERVRAQDLIIAYGTGPREIEDIERKTQKVWMSKNDVMKRYKQGFFIDTAESHVQHFPDEIQEVEDEVQGTSPNEDYRGNNPALILEQHTLLNLDESGKEVDVALPYIIWLDAKTKKVLRIRPRWDEADPNRNPIEYYTHYQYLPNPEGFYGLGVGHLIGKLNTAINKMLRQAIDAGELANTGNMSGFISESMGTKGGELEMVMGKFVKVPKSVENLRNSILPMAFPGPNQTYIGLMEFLQNIAQRVSSTTQAATGDVEKVIQPLSLMTMLEQSLQMPTLVMEQMASSFEKELKKIYRLNRKYLPDQQYFMDGGQTMQVTRFDYMPDFRVMPILDPRNITTQQKLAKAQALYDFAINNPLIASNQMAMHDISKRFLNAMEIEEVDNILPPLPEPIPPENIDDQELENVYMLMPGGEKPDFDVYPDQDHLRHIQEIDGLLKYLNAVDPLDVPGVEEDLGNNVANIIATISEEEKQRIIAELMVHRQKHVAFLYGVKEGVIPSGQGRVGEMEEFVGNQGAVQVPGQAVPGQGMPIDLPVGASGEIPGAIPGAGGDIGMEQGTSGIVAPEISQFEEQV